MFWYGVLVCLFLVIYVLSFRLIVPKIVEQRLEQYQGRLLERQMEEIQSTYKELRGWRHDWRNHMQVLKIYVENGELEKAGEYIAQMGEAFDKVDQAVRSGNTMADAIINSKLSLAREKEIALDTTFRIPEHLPISDMEFCVLFGNLMDNAIESCMTLLQKEQRFIRIYAGTFRQQFYLSISNATSKDTRTASYHTGKSGDHGFGLYHIDSVVKCHDGYLNRNNEPGVFQTEIMIPFVS